MVCGSLRVEALEGGETQSPSGGNQSQHFIGEIVSRQFKLKQMEEKVFSNESSREASLFLFS
jgi:hypothetical protein